MLPFPRKTRSRRGGAGGAQAALPPAAESSLPPRVRAAGSADPFLEAVFLSPAAYERARRNNSLAISGRWVEEKRARFDASCLLGSARPQEDRDDSLLPEHFRAEWRLASKCGLSLRCLISASYLPEAATQRKWPLKGMIFCFTHSLLSWGCFFCFLSSILFLPSPEQKRSYISSGSVFMGESFFFFLLTTFFS